VPSAALPAVTDELLEPDESLSWFQERWLPREDSWVSFWLRLLREELLSEDELPDELLEELSDELSDEEDEPLTERWVAPSPPPA
jgi:hypothetical protein